MIAARLIGPLEVEVAGRRFGPRDLGGPKPKQVLEILLLERGGLVPKERLADHMWGEALPRSVSGTLETYVSRLRRELGDEGRHLIVTEPQGYRVDSRGLDIDLDRFDELSGRETVEDLEAALELVRGELLSDEPYAAWVVGPRGVYGERVVRTLLAAAEMRLRAGDPRRALGHAERAAALDQVREAAHRTVMRAHQAMGERDQALRAYERCRAILVSELGVDPAPETSELHLRILQADMPVHVEARPAGEPDADARLALLGRETELARLERAARAALAGDPALVLIEGEPGIGKSRLIDELLMRVGTVRAGRAKCFELDGDLPFVPIAEAIRDLLDEVPDAGRFPALGEILPELGASGLPAEAARSRALESLTQLIVDRSPVVVVVDDLQWADPSSIAALSYLRRRAHRSPLLLLGAFRSDAVPAHPVRSLQPDLVVRLGPLTAPDVAALGVPGLHERTGGNPLFVVECLRAASRGRPNQIPHTLQETILDRCRAAGPVAHRILAVASILGRSFDSGVLAHMTGHDEAALVEELDLLRDRGLLATSGERFDFCHDVIRETLAASVSQGRRKVLHRRALDALEASGAEPGEMARHAEGAGAASQAVRYATAAGDAARERWANTEAANHYERALSIADSHPDLLDPPQVEMLAIRLARVLVVLGRSDEARSLAERAHSSARSRDDGRAVFEALDALGVALHRGLSRPSLAVQVGGEALEVARRVGDPALVGRGHVLVGAPAASLGMLDEAMRHYRESLALAERSGGPLPAWPQGRMGLALHHFGRSAEAIAWSERAETAALEQHDEETLLMSRWVRGLSLAALGRYRDAWAMLESAAGIGKGEEVFWHARFPNSFGSILADCCLWTRALDRDLAGLDIAGTAGGPVREAWAQTILNVASDRTGLGQLDEARSALGPLLAQIEDIEYARFRWLSRLHHVQAELHLSSGDVSASLDAAKRCLGMAAEYRLPKYEVRGKLALARALAAAGDLQEALAPAREAGRLADRLSFPALSWRAWGTAAGISGSKGDLSRAKRAVVRCAEGLDDPLREEFLRAVPIEP